MSTKSSYRRWSREADIILSLKSSFGRDVELESCWHLHQRTLILREIKSALPRPTTGQKDRMIWYKNVKEFLAEYRASKAEYSDYQSAVARWEQQTGNKAEMDSMKTRLQKKQQEVREWENNRQSHYYRNDRDDR